MKKVILLVWLFLILIPKTAIAWTLDPGDPLYATAKANGSDGPIYVPVGSAVNFTATAPESDMDTREDPEGNTYYYYDNVTVSWSFGSSEREATHTYTTPGQYTETLTVDDSPGEGYYNDPSAQDSVVVYVVKVETETEATVPLNRTRKKLGVGENVTLTFRPAELTPIAWSISGNGTLSATSGNPITFTAYERASTPSVTATYESVSCTVGFTVVEPASESAVKLSEDTYPAGTQGAGMQLEITISPTDVSFENVESQEVPGPATNITGYFMTHTPPAHETAGWVRIAPGNKKYDQAAFYGWPPPWSAGGFQWVIPIQWRVVGSSYIGGLPNRVQTFSITGADGTSTVSKLGQSVTRTP